MHELIRNRPLATLVTLGANGINANHIPLHLAPTPELFGVLRGHIARANPLWLDLDSELIRWPYSTARTLISALLGMRLNRKPERLFRPGITR
ncbi:MAG: FMN-binding negative transcriptional regulator [Methylobacter sp.]|nr:FMN-binding negative transcriptional regulator [Methylobacter sp.]